MASDGSAVDGSTFRDGTSILWGKFSKVTVGGLFLGFVVGVQKIQAGLSAAVGSASAAVGSFLGDVLDIVVAEPGRILLDAWTGGLGLLRAAGPFVPLVAFAMVGVYLYVWLGGDDS